MSKIFYDECLDLNEQLFDAITEGDRSRVKFLLSIGADPNFCNGLGLAVLLYSIKLGYCEIVDDLIFHGAMLDTKSEAGETALTVAIRMGRSDIVDSLLSAGANIDLAGCDGYSPLNTAILSGMDSIAIELIRYGSDTRLKDETDSDPIMLCEETANLTVFVHIILLGTV